MSNFFNCNSELNWCSVRYNHKLTYKTMEPDMDTVYIKHIPHLYIL